MSYTIMGFALNALIKIKGTATKPAGGTKFFMFLFCLTNLPQNFGPNTTTFIIPGRIFPARYRSTGHGISAATGNSARSSHRFEILALFMLTGVFSTLLVPKTKGKSLEVLSNENQEGFMQPPSAQMEVDNGPRIEMREM
ncbi:hypothetical protein DFH09DRAFT_1314714 [Mycena vulgaris]|nr:hypothetical protein DFH09DRAFT_1314714 [Mycena vulgaris]